MLPTGIGAVLLLLIFVPGWAYLSWVERVRPAVGRSGLSELLEVAAMGVATTGPTVLLLVLIPHEWLPFTLDLEQWASGNDHPRDDFAAGDVIGAPQFVYLAAHHGALAAENALPGRTHRVDLAGLPRVTFTTPQIAAAGLTEAEARDAGQRSRRPCCR